MENVESLLQKLLAEIIETNSKCTFSLLQELFDRDADPILQKLKKVDVIKEIKAFIRQNEAKINEHNNRLVQNKEAEKEKLKKLEDEARNREKKNKDDEKKRIEEEYEKELERVCGNVGRNLRMRWHCTAKGLEDIYVIVNEDTNTYLRLSDSDFDTIYNAVRSSPAIYQTIKITHESYNTFLDGLDGVNKKKKINEKEFMQLIIQRFKTDPAFQLHEAPVNITSDPKIPNFFYVNPEKLIPGPHPCYDSFLSQFDSESQEIFKAYVYSIFEEKHRGRQALWIQSEGEDKKSIIMKSIIMMMGDTAQLSISDEYYKDQFYTSSVFGKRLLYNLDCQNPYILNNELSHKILGGDPIPIRRMRREPESAPTYSRILICSNTVPKINTYEKNAVSRLLLVRMERRNPVFIDNLYEKLTKEFWHFLYSCRESYNRITKNHYEITVSSKQLDILESECTSDMEIMISNWIESTFVHKDGECVQSAVVTKMFVELKNKRGNGWNSNALTRMMRNKFKYHKTKKRISPHSNPTWVWENLCLSPGIIAEGWQSTPMYPSVNIEEDDK